MLQLADLLQLLGLDHGAVQIHHDDAEIAVRQVERIADRILDPVDHHLSAAPQDPERDLALFGERDLGQERQRQPTENETAQDDFSHRKHPSPV